MKSDTTPLSKYGLDLTLSQRKALTAIQILLAETDYKGNNIFVDINSKKLHGNYKCPSIDVSFFDYLRIYGLSEKQIKQKGQAKKEALQALYSLEKDYRVAYTKKVKIQGTNEIKTIAVCCDIKLINVAQMTVLEEQARPIKEIEKDKRARFLRIIVGPLLLEQIKSFFTLKPYFLIEEIESVSKGASKKKSNLLFIDWLLSLNLNYIKISGENLGEKLRLESYIKARKKSIVNGLIEQAISIALKLNFIKSWKKEDNIFEFKLNPVRCSRLKKNSTPKIEEIDSAQLNSLSPPEYHNF